MFEQHRTERYRRRADVRFRIIDREAVILRQAAAENVVLNEVGSSILKSLDDGCTVTEAAERLLAEYDVSPEQLAEDMPTFLEELENAGVVERILPEVDADLAEGSSQAPQVLNNAPKVP